MDNKPEDPADTGPHENESGTQRSQNASSDKPPGGHIHITYGVQQPVEGQTGQTVPLTQAPLRPQPADAAEAHSADTLDHNAPRKPHRWWLWITIAVVVILLIVVVSWRRHEKNKASAAAAARAANAAVTISAVTATRGDINVYLDAIGTVTPIYTDAITSQVSGLIEAVNYREDQRVYKGESLIEIDARPYQATLMQAEGTLERDQNVLAQAQEDLKRYQAALARNAIAEQQVADQEKLVLQDQGTVKNDQGTVQYDQLQVAYCHISSPIDGQVGLRLVDPGNVVQANGTTALAVITQLQPITVVFTLSEDSLGQVTGQLRNKAKLAVDAYDRTAQKKLASGVLVALDNQIDTTTGTVKARAQFDNKDAALFPNQFVNTRLLVTTEQGVTLIPASAVQQNGQNSFVYVIQNNVAHMRAIKPGVSEAGQIAVEGINPGDVVADSSFEKLQDNSKVTIAPAGGAKPNNAANPPAGSGVGGVGSPGGSNTSAAAGPGAATSSSGSTPASSNVGATSPASDASSSGSAPAGGAR